MTDECNAHGIDWPARCGLPRGHKPAEQHHDPEFGPWSSAERQAAYRLETDDATMASELWAASPDGKTHEAELKAKLDTLPSGSMTVNLEERTP